jgi:hypothetical protein
MDAKLFKRYGRIAIAIERADRCRAAPRVDGARRTDLQREGLAARIGTGAWPSLVPEASGFEGAFQTERRDRVPSGSAWNTSPTIRGRNHAAKGRALCGFAAREWESCEVAPVKGLQNSIQQEHGIDRARILERSSEGGAVQALLDQYQQPVMHTDGRATTSFPAFHGLRRCPKSAGKLLPRKSEGLPNFPNAARRESAHVFSSPFDRGHYGEAEGEEPPLR